MRRSHLLRLFVLIVAYTAWLTQSSQAGQLRPKTAHATRYIPAATSGPRLGPNSHSLEGGAISSVPDTVRILAIRVQFQPDNLSTTTGDGTFLLEPSSEYAVDPPPHDRRYFEAQIQALANYYRSVSGGKLIVEGDVYPREESSSYTLPHQMDYYHPPEADSDDSLRDLRLSELLRDAVKAADGDTAVRFDRYDCVIVFHAGVGQDFAFDFDPTPNDIPSVFLDSLTVKEHLGSDGISVDNGEWTVREGIILPEAQSQEGYEIGLLGTACLMFAQWLGIPALYNTKDGRPGIGMWGLMDQGSNNGSGLLPAQPCAWTRVFMGWCDPIVVHAGQDLPVAAWKTRDPHKVYKIPINDHEYFLIENRQRDVNRDGIAVGRDHRGNRVEIKFDNQGNLQVLHEGTLGVITQIDEYDFGLPGSGILIWHVDEEVLRRGLAENRVNADPEHRAVDLEEADGAQDIGQQYGFLSPGAGAENGVPEDAYWAKNEINMLVNASEKVEFGPHTEPNSNSYSGAVTGILITDFSDLDSVMTFSVRKERVVAGFPVWAGAEASGHPLVADIDGDGSDEILLATRDGRLVCWRGDGSPFAPSTRQVAYAGVGQDTLWYPDATFFTAPPGNEDGPILAPILSTDGASPLVFWGARRGLWALRAADPGKPPAVAAHFDSARLSGTALHSWKTPAGTLYTLYPQTEGLRFVWVSRDSGLNDLSLVPTPYQILDFAGAGPRGFYLLASSEQRVVLEAFDSQLRTRWTAVPASSPTSLVAGDLDGNGSVEVVTLAPDGTVDALGEDGQRLPGFPTRAFGTCSGRLALGDVDGKGGAEIVFTTDYAQAYVLSRNGVTLPGWPVDLRPAGERGSAEGQYSSTTPILVDLNDDGAAEVLVADQRGGLVALGQDGQPLPGFPLATSTRLTGVAAGDIDGDGLLELVAAGAEGLVYAWETDAAEAGAVWPQPLADASATACLPGPVSPPQPPAGEGNVLVLGSLHCFPNPTAGQAARIRFTLKKDARVRAEIYDLAGSKVAELSGHGAAGLENELVWDTSGTEPGVYFVRLVVGGETEIVKLAVTP